MPPLTPEPHKANLIINTKPPIDLTTFCEGIALHDNGIWYGKQSEPVSYPTVGNEQSYAVEDRSFWFRHRNDCIRTVIEMLPPDKGEPIFDIGGGNGYVAAHLCAAGYPTVVLEPGPNGAANAKQRGVANVVCSTFNTAQFRAKTVGAIGLFDVVEHVENNSAFISKVRDVLKPGGRLYVTVPAYNWLWSDEDIRAGHHRRYTINKLARSIGDAGFRIDFATYVFAFLPIAIFVARTLPFVASKIIRYRHAPTEIHGHSHHEKHALLTNAITLLTRREIKLISQCKPIRFGSSCLVAATRG